jgi:hypothetical protein
MDIAPAFKGLLDKTLAPTLKQHGFSQSGRTFYLRREGNWGLVNFQKSTKSSAERIVFAVNLGIASSRLLEFFPPRRLRVSGLAAKPQIWDCHWQMRLGSLVADQKDIWWTVEANTRLEQLGLEIDGYIRNLAIPELSKYIRDEALRDLWLSGHAPGLTEFMRLMNLSVLLKTLGPLNLLEPTLNELWRVAEGKPIASVAEIHMQRLKLEGVEWISQRPQG